MISPIRSHHVSTNDQIQSVPALQEAWPPAAGTICLLPPPNPTLRSKSPVRHGGGGGLQVWQRPFPCHLHQWPVLPVPELTAAVSERPVRYLGGRWEL